MKILMDAPLRLPPYAGQKNRHAVVLPFPGQTSLPRGCDHPMPRRDDGSEGRAQRLVWRSLWASLRQGLRRRAERQALARQLRRLPDHLLADLGIDAEGNHNEIR
ncbi:hypothetical protein BTR14_02965 [Rhizobium rhizosphaerae]|uniref:DUF1127 domain-containing protein n=1 Tax=Xaviernesmea rhizosphaerae TaxID=1672749 RepID=A0ABX3PJN3_9HYPH|nr:DUF1127 domain-containing protein [Xaviernesmea rhizosphaerae]OQP88405.1 hypothetical protein BTR14_02965 [Xaviernesmea rhizosphaerae]